MFAVRSSTTRTLINRTFSSVSSSFVAVNRIPSRTMSSFSDVRVPDASRFNLYPENVGIKAMDIYFPKHYVEQADLEKHDNIPAGKYTIGLGQTELAFVEDNEDIYSICLSAVANFMEKYNIDYKDIGRLEVASETILDHSKATKTYLMKLFEESGNSDVEGVDTMNACYAGTNALFNSLSWIESSSWDGRYALVVAADIAEYAEGPARPTGGCGAVVMLVGPDAPLAIERGARASHMEHVYDFYKPNLSSPYPVVDGHFSNICYLKALDTCYTKFVQKYGKIHNGEDFNLDNIDHAVFHAPYNKLVQKSFGRLLYNDFLRYSDREEFAEMKQFAEVEREESYTDRGLEKAFTTAAKPAYKDKVAPGTILPARLGNMYTASAYAGLLSLAYDKSQQLRGKRIMMFSYGSGLAASLFSIKVPDTDKAAADLQKIHDVTNLEARLDSRTKRTPQEFSDVMKVRETLHAVGEYAPAAEATDKTVFPGTFVLENKDDKGRRFYKRMQ